MLYLLRQFSFLGGGGGSGGPWHKPWARASSSLAAHLRTDTRARRRPPGLPLSAGGEAGAAGAEQGTKDGGQWVLAPAFRRESDRGARARPSLGGSTGYHLLPSTPRGLPRARAAFSPSPDAWGVS